MKKNIIYITIIILLGLALVFVYYKYNQAIKLNKQNLFYLNQAKSQVEQELKILSNNYESLDATNESLQKQINIEKLKIEQLLKELKQNKQNSYSVISKYQKEIISLKTTLTHYNIKIDSLNNLNKMLSEENIVIKEEVEKASLQITELEEEKTQMGEIIDRAKKLEAMKINPRGLKKNGKKTSRAKRTVKIETSFILNKNKTATKGTVTLYVIITNPNGVILGNSKGNMFDTNKGKKIYSAKREIYYGGDFLNVSVFYNISTKIGAGSYDIEIFANGDSIGKSFFTLK